MAVAGRTAAAASPGTVHRLWYGDGVIWRLAALGLRPLSAIYGAVTHLRGALYDRGILRSHRLPGTTISIGNLEAGGTGKTPVTRHVAELLLARGARPAVLSRGYGAGIRRGDSMVLLGGRVVLAPAAPVGLPPDEARMLSELLPDVPVVLGPDRWRAAQRFLAEKPGLAPTHWLLDDGFQHRALRRDVDVVLLDAARPWGNARLLPAGSLREPPSALRRARVVVFTRCEKDKPDAAAVAAVQAASPAATVVKASFHTAMAATDVTGTVAYDRRRHRRLVAVAGVGRPDHFLGSVGATGGEICGFLQVSDHAPIPRQGLTEAVGGAGAGTRTCDAVVTTAKDYWRDPEVFAGLPVPVFILELSVVMPGAIAGTLLGDR